MQLPGNELKLLFENSLFILMKKTAFSLIGELFVKPRLLKNTSLASICYEGKCHRRTTNPFVINSSMDSSREHATTSDLIIQRLSERHSLMLISTMRPFTPTIMTLH